MEYGVGIHGEPGIKRCNVMNADELASKMVESLCKELNLGTTKEPDRIALLVNGFGATPLMELYLLNASVNRILHKKGITVAHTLVGNYMTSIDMEGASISILKLDDELETLYKASCNTPALKLDSNTSAAPYYEPFERNKTEEVLSYEIETPSAYSEINGNINLQNMLYIVDTMSHVIIKNEIPFCELDSHAGDGDFGMSVAKGFRQLKKEWKSILATKDLTISSFLDACSLIIMEHCGGASGPIWGSAFRAASRNVLDKNELTMKDFASMLQAAVAGIQATGERSFGRGAVVGDKTLIDALVPCADAWSSFDKSTIDFVEAFMLGAKRAVEGAKKTEEIAARMGRAGTVGDRSIGYPDAGAYALGVIFTEIANSIAVDPLLQTY